MAVPYTIIGQDGSPLFSGEILASASRKEISAQLKTDSTRLGESELDSLVERLSDGLKQVEPGRSLLVRFDGTTSTLLSALPLPAEAVGVATGARAAKSRVTTAPMVGVGADKTTFPQNPDVGGAPASFGGELHDGGAMVTSREDSLELIVRLEDLASRVPPRANSGKRAAKNEFRIVVDELNSNHRLEGYSHFLSLTELKRLRDVLQPFSVYQDRVLFLAARVFLETLARIVLVRTVGEQRPEAVGMECKSALDKHDVRMYVREGECLRQVTFGEGIENVRFLVPNRRKFAVDAYCDRLEETFGKGLDERTVRLTLSDMEKVPKMPVVVGKDLATCPAVFHMSIGAGNSHGSLDLMFFNSLSKIARNEGVPVGVVVSRDMDAYVKPSLVESNFVVGRTDGGNTAWIQDREKYHGKAISAPAPYGQTTLEMRQILGACRRERFAKLLRRRDSRLSEAEVAEKATKLAEFPYLGAVNTCNQGLEAGGVAAASKRPLYISASSIEGGNMLMGKKANGQPFLIVGQDSVEVSRCVLSDSLGGREVSDEELKKWIGVDYGGAPENVLFVEQPGEFHLDMSMVLMAPGMVLLNDAQAAFLLQSEKMREELGMIFEGPLRTGEYEPNWVAAQEKQEAELLGLKAKAESLSFYETIVAEQLKDAGFEVHRIAGRFFDPLDPADEIMNFVNGVGGTSLTRGGTFFVTQGGEKWAEEYIAMQLLGTIPTGLDRLYFQERGLTRQTLSLKGALACRVQAEGI